MFDVDAGTVTVTGQRRRRGGGIGIVAVTVTRELSRDTQRDVVVDVAGAAVAVRWRRGGCG